MPVAGELPRYRAPQRARRPRRRVTVAALAIPSAMAYAEVAGLSPVNGLYALLLPTVAYVLLGSSRQLVIGPEGSISTLVAAAILSLAVAGQRRCCRAGGDARAARRGVLRARVAAAARLDRRLLLTAGAGRLHPRGRRRPRHRSAREAARSVDRRAGPAAAALGGRARARERQRRHGRSSARSRLRCCSYCGCFMPRLPAALLVVVAAIGVSWALDLQAHGIAVVGPIPAGLPSFDLPEARAGRTCPPGAGGGRHLPGLVRGRDPDGALVRREAQPERARVPGAARDGRRERRGRRHPGLLDRRKRLAHGGQRQDGRAEPDRRHRRCRHRAGDPALPHRAGAVPAEGRARRRDRLSSDRPRRPERLAQRSPRSTRSRSRSPA